MKVSMLLFATTLVTLCSGSGNLEKVERRECNKLVLEKAERLSPYEFTTIKNTIKVEDVYGYAIAFYNVYYEYSTKSVLFLIKYDGDIFGDVHAWFVNIDEKIYIEDVGLSEMTSSQNRIFVEYRDSSGRSCREDLRLS